MRLAFLVNPRSGRGRAPDIARDFETAAARAGHRVQHALLVEPGAAAGCDAVVVFGGDGSLNRALPLAIAAGAPIYHVPLGTESLFAREFGMTRSPELLLSALQRGEVARVDLGEFNGRPFALMASFGPDAAVIARVASSRRGPITHLTYIGPVLREFLLGRCPHFDLRADGREVLRGEPGMLVVANSRRYGAHAGPARRASMDDGLLDVVFLPGEQAVLPLMGLVAAKLRRPLDDSLGVYLTAEHVEVRSPMSPAQIDGEAAGVPGFASIRVLRGALRVLRP